jgi:hypothetical protein
LAFFPVGSCHECSVDEPDDRGCAQIVPLDLSVDEGLVHLLGPGDRTYSDTQSIVLRRIASLACIGHHILFVAGGILAR